MKDVGTHAVVLLCTLAAPLTAQIYGNGSDGALAPSADTTLDTSANGGVFQFTSIAIPAGVTVHLVGSNPGLLLCSGSVTIAGTLEGDGKGSVFPNGPYRTQGGPGGYAGGLGGFNGPPTNGQGPGGGSTGSLALYSMIWGNPAAHATRGYGFNYYYPPEASTYGAALPFDFQGGSGGGSGGEPTASYGDYGPPGTGGGGAIAILAEGPVAVTGRISARGGVSEFHTFVGPSTGGAGSGGSILLRSLQCMQVHGTVDASGGTSWFGGGGDGFVRIDGYCGAPDLTGSTVRPAPLVLQLPFLTAFGTASIGQTYRVRCASTPGDVFGLYTSPGTGSLPLPPFGLLQLDPAAIYFLGQFTVPTTGVDPLAAADIPVPNARPLLGLTLYSQMFNAFGAANGQPRLSNLLVSTIRL